MPMFKKSGGKIFAVQFNKAEERALDQEIKKQIVENDRAFDMDKESSILWMLHTQFGFGPKRLKLAWKLFYAETRKLREHYLMEQCSRTASCPRLMIPATNFSAEPSVILSSDL